MFIGRKRNCAVMCISVTFVRMQLLYEPVWSSLTQSKQQSHQAPHISSACYHIAFSHNYRKTELDTVVTCPSCMLQYWQLLLYFPHVINPLWPPSRRIERRTGLKGYGTFIYLQGTSCSYLPYTSIDISCGVDMSLLLYAVTYWIMHHAQYFALIKLNLTLYLKPVSSSL